jgi:hypothetical protein
MMKKAGFAFIGALLGGCLGALVGVCVGFLVVFLFRREIDTLYWLGVSVVVTPAAGAILGAVLFAAGNRTPACPVRSRQRQWQP